LTATTSKGTFRCDRMLSKHSGSVSAALKTGNKTDISPSIKQARNDSAGFYAHPPNRGDQREQGRYHGFRRQRSTVKRDLPRVRSLYHPSCIPAISSVDRSPETSPRAGRQGIDQNRSWFRLFKEIGTEVTLTGIRQDHNDGLPPVLRSPG
jgi:hypothetical protein